MKYYLHDTNSFQDEKVTQLYMQFGYEGLGLFYTTLEKLALQEKPIKTAVLKAQLNVGKKLEKCWEFMESLEIISSNNGETFNIQLLNYSEKYKIKKENNKKRISEWRDNHEDTKSVTRYEQKCNSPKVKESKVKVYKEKKEKQIPFNESLIYDKNKFKESFLDWGNEKLKYYYDAAERYSNEGNKYVDWKAAVKSWATKDQLTGKIIFNKVPSQILSGVI